MFELSFEEMEQVAGGYSLNVDLCEVIEPICIIAGQDPAKCAAAKQLCEIEKKRREEEEKKKKEDAKKDKPSGLS